MIEGPQAGWGRPEVVGGFAGFVALIVAFVVVERRTGEPMFDLALLSQRRFIRLCLAVMAFVAVFTPLAMDLPSYLIATGGLRPRQAGVWMMMLGVPTLVFPAVAAALTRWVPARHQVVSAIVLAGGGAANLLNQGDLAGAVARGVPAPAAAAAYTGALTRPRGSSPRCARSRHRWSRDYCARSVRRLSPCRTLSRLRRVRRGAGG